MRRSSTIEVKQNLQLTVRERGKVVARRDGHNIWLNLGKEFLAQLMSYSSFSPLTPYTDHRVRYMGLGIGGNRQNAPTITNVAPLSTAYPGTNAQTDAQPTVTMLERPVRVTGTGTTPPYDPSDVWLGQIQAPPTFPTPTSVAYKRVFSQTDVSYGAYSVVPVSEILLCTNAANPAVYNNTGIAYDTFDSLSITNAFELEVVWTIRF